MILDVQHLANKLVHAKAILTRATPCNQNTRTVGIAHWSWFLSMPQTHHRSGVQHPILRWLLTSFQRLCLVRRFNTSVVIAADRDQEDSVECSVFVNLAPFIALSPSVCFQALIPTNRGRFVFHVFFFCGFGVLHTESVHLLRQGLACSVRALLRSFAFG